MVTLATREKCTGCLACYSSCAFNAIELIKDSQGFVYPKINNDTCVNCNKCERVCPVLNGYPSRVEPQNVYAAWKVSELERLQSNSGGVAATLAEKAISLGYLVAGAMIADDLTVKHVLASSVEEINKFRMSKYVQSNIGNIYADIQKAISCGRKVLFFGTPCQADAVKHVVGNKNSGSLVTVDLVCHGVPSPEYLRQHLESFDTLDKIRTYTFRENDHYKFQVFYKDGKKETVEWLDDTYLYAFMKNVMDRECCHNCAYSSIKRTADITLGDFWGIDKLHSAGVKLEQEKGVSAVLLNTEKGVGFFNECTENLFVEKRNIDEVVKYNVFLRPIVETNPDRFWFREQFLKHGFEGAGKMLQKKYRVQDSMYCMNAKFKRAIIKVKNKICK